MTTPGFTLVQLRYFIAAAERGSMTAAADELRIAQSAVSSAIANLEHELRLQLFIRHRARGLTLTSAGERLLAQARDLLTRARDVEAEARGSGGTLSGPVTIGCFVTLAPYYLPALFAACDQHHPDVELNVVEAEAEHLHQALRSGGIDFALTYDLSAPTDTDLHRETIALAPAYVIVPAGHRLADRTTVDLAELAPDPMVLLDLPYSRDYFRAVVATSGTAPDVRYRSQSYETVRSLVAQGLGYSLLNQRPRTDQTYGGGEIVALELRGDRPPLEVTITAVNGVRQTARAQAVMDLLRVIPF
ncbi:LysR family transcriptional regulator [Saccharopolyspora sp. NFXS83]|uniref:LysR family transcriptional regulator n=1 Tax=Saccharopolyspora sp. NFXS83 TaxID=2993560 RepID=UPI00224B9E17|nr:LysR family transcriptional regulator [Saccharopolyspora sp. NFXS83]MCX2730697.1 LysR family transcriptional regulator [Saccharopolyspora sp. NFXS83]